MNQSEKLDQLATALAKAQGTEQEGYAARKVARALRGRPWPQKGFFERIVTGLSDCWFWGGALNNFGYGTDGKHRAHRKAWELFNGPIPEGMSVLHKCDIRCCVNPEHLFLGTQVDNIRDMVAKGRNRGRILLGEDNPVSVLTNEKVKAMRCVRSETGLSYKKIAKQFGISTMTAFRAITGQSWKTL